MKRKDYIAECMDDTGVEASIDQFMNTFCFRCLNPECQRSSINDLKWQQRMDRQLEALNNPVFADPKDPDFKALANQAFTSFEEEHVSVGNWEHFEEPGRFKAKKEKGKPIVHKAEAPTQQHEGSKVTQSVSQLAATKNGGERVKEQEQKQEEEPPTTEPTLEAPSEDPKKPLASQRDSRYNTEVPSGGIILPGKPENAPQQPSKRDGWAIPDDGKKTLVVRADTGEIVEKKDKGN